MTDRPILFSAPMVRALLEGRKTQTRRILKGDIYHHSCLMGGRQIFGNELHVPTYDTVHPERIVKLPAVIGDRLYVREAWRTLHKADCLAPRDLADDLSKITYEADPENRNPLWAFGKFRQGMHMPRWASRLTLIVTEVRVQRLQDISDPDAIAEGIDPKEVAARGWMDARVGYHDLWDSINAGRKDKDGNLLPYAWDDNPWVVAISFDVHKGNIDKMENPHG